MTLADQHQRAIIFDCSNIDLANMKEAIKYYRIVLTSYPPGSRYSIIASLSFSDLLFRAFKCTNEIEYLNEAISFTQDHLTF
jgi:hypothetical protein